MGEWQRSIMMHCGGQARPIVRPAGDEGRGGGGVRGGRAASLPAAPNWLCQTAWPAGRTMRSPNLPSSPVHGDKRSGALPRPL